MSALGRNRWAEIARFLLVSAGLLVTSPAPAQDKPPASAAPTQADRDAAAREFARGEKAFKAGEFVLAATAFEEAHRLAPHPASLWNAARAWHRAGQHARAANLYARYLREAPADAPDREGARAALAELSSRLGRLDIQDQGLTDLRVDGIPAASMSVYVDPGQRRVQARQGGQEITRNVVATAGAAVPVTLGVSIPPPPAGTPAAPSVPPIAAPGAPAAPGASAAAPAVPLFGAGAVGRPPPAESPRSGWSPWVVVIGGGVTLIGAATMVWSIVDADKFHDTANADPENTELEKEAVRRDWRTGIVAGFTGSVAVFTGIAAIWLVDWKGKGSTVKASLGLDPALGKTASGGPGPRPTLSITGSF